MSDPSSETSPATPSFDEAVAQITGPGGLFELTRVEVRGEEYTAFKNMPTSLRELFAGAARHADADFIVYEDERWSFEETLRRAHATGALLVDRYEIKPGDRVAIAMRNYPEWIASFVGITSVGGIAVCLNAWWTTEEIDYALGDCGASLVIADSERIERAAPLFEKFGIPGIAVRAEGALPPGVDHLDDVFDREATLPDVEIGIDDDATILYTSGTTGHPKGAVSSQRAVMSALTAYACRAIADRIAQPPTARETHSWPTSFILVVPLFHVTGLVPVMMSCFAAGYKLVMMYKWNPERALELIEREHITTFVGVPTMSWDLLESPDFERRDTTSLQSIGGGGAPAPPELVHRISRSFRSGRPGIGYGMTETNAYGPQNSGPDYVRKPRSSGRAVPTMQIKVGNAEGKEVPRGEVGEIFFRGVNLIRGYWNNPEATAEAIVDGWLRSGDIGRMDDEGFIFVEDRAKDMVLRAGENIYSAEVEAALYDRQDIYEAAVFGIPHPRLGEEVAAAILLREGCELEIETLQAELKEHLASFKIPSIIEIYQEPLPRNAAGKILKRDLRDLISEKLGR